MKKTQIKDPDIHYIIGPTAIGKSDQAISLAKKLNADIISADAYQVYIGMDIGTAKTNPHEQQGITHHLIDIKHPTEPYNVTNFIQLTNDLIQQARATNKASIICGGNGLFARAFLYSYTFPAAKSDPKIRARLEEHYHTGNKQKLWEELNSKDPISAAKIHPNNKHHLLRALEILSITGQPASSIKKQQPTIRKDTKVIGLSTDRSRVVSRINNRVDSMIKEGLIDEVTALKQSGLSPDLPALKCIGYKECWDYLDNKESLEKTIELIKIHTQQFSKQQMTWFRKIENVLWQNIF